ncbi:hypothetical protein ACFLEY_26665 [Bradyrhizobium sp. YCK136]|uniref:hypothetical protein n=1 Tax=Bradyrhizobium TaxID=374 RepID=UPI001B8AE3B6|nr:hypothetical protein [Bradyrhizobium diazoefficiens]MBR0861203.1 hypothetical protein [Bradyrhizobium diazoefficiens]MBR0890299.1 hypothetical protein [Bradyrhizobium diazoefficiens]MBR0922073.1 hypothetical protein [Bradyrhizobium diazoefficiens]
MTDFHEDIDDDETPTEDDLDQIYGSKYLSAADIGTRKVRTTNTRVRMRDLPNADGTRQPKFLLYFEDLRKPLVLNKVNTNELIKKLGRKPAGWIGADVVVYVDPNVTYNGKQGGVRLRVLAAAPAKSGPPIRDEPAHDDMDDDIPL